MRKMPLCSFFLFLITSLSGSSFHNLPKFFFVEDQTGLSTLYNIKTEKTMLGIASQELSRLSASFQLKNTQEEILATAQSHFYCWGIVANIWNPFHEKLGWIEEQSFQWFTQPVCRIYDDRNHLVGVAQRNFWGNKLIIKDPNNHDRVYAIIHRPWHRYSSDLWQVYIYDETPFQTKTIDPSILVLLATYDSHHNQESKVIEYIQDDEYVYMNKDGFIQLGVEVNHEPQVHFKEGVSNQQKQKITSLLSELTNYSVYFQDKLSENKDVLLQDELEIEGLLEEYLASEAASEVAATQMIVTEEITYADQLQQRITSEVNRWIRTIEMGLALLKRPDIGFQQKESLYHMLNEFVLEITN